MNDFAARPCTGRCPTPQRKAPPPHTRPRTARSPTASNGWRATSPPSTTATNLRRKRAMTALDQTVSVRYLVDDVDAAVEFYTNHLGFTVNTNAAPAFADVTNGNLRLLLSGPTSSGTRSTPASNSAPG